MLTSLLRRAIGVRLESGSSRSSIATLGCVFGLSAMASVVAPAASAQIVGDQRFISSAIVSDDGTVNLPLYRGTSQGRTIFYIITESSSQSLATQLGVNYAPALANARGSGAVQRVSIASNGQYVFPASVTFNRTRRLDVDAEGLPLSSSTPGAVGETGYSPLIELPDGTILNAPHLIGPTGRAARVISSSSTRVVMEMSDGFHENQPVRYIVTEASNGPLAALENVTFAPALQSIPSNADAGLAAMVAGQTGLTNAQRQGLGAARDDGQDPLNIIEYVPSQSDYSPIWEAEPHRWTPAEVSAGRNTRQRDYDTVEALEAQGRIQEIAVDQYVNCPVITRRLNSVSSSVALTLVGASVEYIQSSGGGFDPFAPILQPTISPESSFVFQTTVEVQDGRGRAAPGVTVYFGGSQLERTGTFSCVTNSAGTCSVADSDSGQIPTPIAVGGIQTYIGSRNSTF